MKKQKTEKMGHRYAKSCWKVVVALILTISALVLPVRAWLYSQRSMQTVTMVNEPEALKVGEGNMAAISELNLGQIDVSKNQQYKDVVFCVYGKDKCSYQIQLAHTTNIGFTYTIYKATLDNENGTIPDNSGNNKFNQGDKLNGSYLNKTESGIANDNYHAQTYPGSGDSPSYNNVQKNAEPLYWKTGNPEWLPDDPVSGGYRVNYYILRVSWKDNSSIQNTKETDMVYLMAKKTGGSEQGETTN